MWPPLLAFIWAILCLIISNGYVVGVAFQTNLNIRNNFNGDFSDQIDGGDTYDFDRQSMQFIQSTLTPSEALLPTQEVDALFDLFQSTNGSTWRWQGLGNRWDFSNSSNTSSPINPCYDMWEGIICSCSDNTTIISIMTNFTASYYYYYYSYDDGIAMRYNRSQPCHIVKLLLNNHNLRGSIPFSLGENLQAMTHLHMTRNYLTGFLPSSLFNNSNLARLDFSYNSLTGTLPLSIGQAKALLVLSLGYNLLSGPIPSEIGELLSLNGLNLKQNSLSGLLPTSMANLQNLEFLFLESNHFSGSIPSFLYSLERVEFLTLANNSWTPSSLPSELGQLKNLQVLCMNNCSLIGSIPDSIRNLSKLKVLWVQQNSLTGTFPSSLLSIKPMNVLWLSENSFTGTIPTLIGEMSLLNELHLRSNSFSGTLPTEIARISTLESLMFSYNTFQGSIPLQWFPTMDSSELYSNSNPYLLNLKYLDICSNRITGTIPAEIFLLSSLSMFAAAGNCIIVQTLPLTVCQAYNITELVLDGLNTASACRSSRFIPVSIKGYDPISYPDENGIAAQLTGASSPYIQPCIFSLPKLAGIHLSGNGLFGNLEFISNSRYPIKTSNFLFLNLAHNYLSGTIPAALLLLSTFQTFDMSFNRFSGTIDSRMQALPPTSMLNLSVNRLSGAVPEGLLHMQNINILAGNSFGCSLDIDFGTNLNNHIPSNDPDYDKFVCTSNNFSLSVVIWSIFFGVLLFSLGMTGIYYRQEFHGLTSDSIQATRLACSTASNLSVLLCSFGSRFLFQLTSLLVKDTIPSDFAVNNCDNNDSRSLKDFEQALHILRKTFFFTAFGMAIYISIALSILTALYGTRAQDYAYMFSAGHLSGLLPGIFLGLLVFLSLFGAHQYINLKMEVLIASSMDMSCEDVVGIKDRMTLLIKDRLSVFGTKLSMVSRMTDFSKIQKQLDGEAEEIEEGCIEENKEGDNQHRDNLSEAGSISMNSEYSSRTTNTLTRITSMGIQRALLSQPAEPSLHRWLHFLTLSAVGLFNLVFVVVTNCLYIYSYIGVTFGRASVFWIAVAFATFKLFWALVMIPYLVAFITAPFFIAENPDISQDRIAHNLSIKVRNLTFEVMTTVFNTVLVPCAANLIVAPHCLFFLFTDMPYVRTVFHWPYCSLYNIAEDFRLSSNSSVTNSSAVCISLGNMAMAIAYEPPFQYKYECSASITSAYSYVFVYMFITIGFILPFGRMALAAILRKINNPQSCVSRTISSLLPVYSLPVSYLEKRNTSCQKYKTSDIYARNTSYDNPMIVGIELRETTTQRKSDKTSGTLKEPQPQNIIIEPPLSLFNIDVFIVQCCQLISIIISFGFVNPPVAVLGFIALSIHTYTKQIQVKLFAEELRYEPKLALYYSLLLEECHGLAILLRHCIWYCFPVGYLLFGFFVFDTIGDFSVGNNLLQAILWPACLGILIGIMYILSDHYHVILLQWFRNKY